MPPDLLVPPDPRAQLDRLDLRVLLVPPALVVQLERKAPLELE